MASYNRVYSEFWPETRDWSPDEQRMAMYLLTCTHRRTEGLYRLRPAYMADDLGWELDVVRRSLDALVARGWIVFDGTWLCLLKALRRNDQRPAGPKQIAGAVRAVEAAPRDGRPYAAFHAAARRYAPDFAVHLDQPTGPDRPAPDTPPEGYPHPSGYPSDSSTSASTSTSTTTSGSASAVERASVRADVAPSRGAEAPSCPGVVRDMLLAAGFDAAELDHGDQAIGQTLRHLELPDDVDWPAFGRLIVRYRASGRLKKHGPCPALRFVARRADGPPRIGDAGRRVPGQRSPVGHYASMFGGGAS